jgi:DNA primase
MCHQSGFTNTVATSGTSLTNQHLEKLQKLSDNLMLVYDADKAGLKATLRAWTSALALGMDVKVASLPKGEDPASLLLKDKEVFKNGIKHAKHIIDYYIDILVKEGLTESQFKKSVEKEVLPYVAVVDSAIERSNFISKVSVKTGIYESDLREEVEKIRSNPNSKDVGTSGNKSGADTSASGTPASSTISYSKESRPDTGRPIDDIVLRRVGALVVWLKNSHKDNGQDTSKVAEVDGKRVDDILEKVSSILPESEFIYFKHNVEHSPEELLFEAEILFDGSKKIDQDISELLHELEERTLKHKLSRTMMELGLAEKKKDTAKAEELLKICSEISTKLSELNRRKEH